MGSSWFVSSLQSPNKAVCGVSAGRIKFFSKKFLTAPKDITEEQSLKLCNGVSSFLSQKERNGTIFTRKTNNFLNKMLLRILYWKERKCVLIVAKRGKI